MDEPTDHFVNSRLYNFIIMWIVKVLNGSLLLACVIITLNSVLELNELKSSNNILMLVNGCLRITLKMAKLFF